MASAARALETTSTATAHSGGDLAPGNNALGFAAAAAYKKKKQALLTEREDCGTKPPFSRNRACDSTKDIDCLERADILATHKSQHKKRLALQWNEQTLDPRIRRAVIAIGRPQTAAT